MKEIQAADAGPYNIIFPSGIIYEANVYVL